MGFIVEPGEYNPEIVLFIKGLLGLFFLILGIFFYQEFKSFLTAVIFFVTAIGFFYRS